MKKTSVQALYIPIEQTQHLASGLWGSVFRVIGTEKIVKVPKDANNGLYEIEKKIYERLGDHDSIARYLGEAVVGAEEEENPGLLCRYYPSSTLQEFFNSPASSEIRINQEQQLQWTVQILDGLAYIHSRDIIHGDVGIHNILVGDNNKLMFNDFGGSSIDGASMLVECSPRYHRPHSWRFPIKGVDSFEETWKIPTRKMDTFAVGTVLYEIFTGAQLYKGETYDQIRQHATRREYPDLQVIRLPEVRAVIADCWTEKYGSIEEVIRDLQPIWTERA